MFRSYAKSRCAHAAHKGRISNKHSQDMHEKIQAVD